MEGEIITMDQKIHFTQEELQMLYAACMAYGGRLSEIIKSIPNEEDFIREEMSKKVRGHYKLARKITEYIEE